MFEGYEFPKEYPYQVDIFWTTRHPYDPMADWKEWLDANIPPDQMYHDITDVVPRDQDEGTIITIGFKDEQYLILFLLAVKCEVWNIRA
jgi:hypothetical protein